MSDTSALPQPPASASRGLVYPFESPGDGRSMDVAPGVLWIRMPMPGSLKHINLWALRDGDGWSLVDTGLQNPDTTAAWQRLWRPDHLT